MTRPSLIIFIDCFPHRALTDGFLSGLPGRARVRPGFGYSVNIVAELFAGTTPDDLGYLNIFSYNPENRWLRRWSPALRLLAPLRHWYLADRVAHRGLARVAGYVGNIPFRYLEYFEPTGVYPFSTAFSHPTLFDTSEPRATRVFHSDLVGVRAPNRDRVLLDRANAEVRRGESLFVSLSDLDAIAHAHGVQSGEFAERVAELDGWLADLIERFIAVNPGAFVAVVSDHGAADTTGTVDLAVERHFGSARPDRYMFFLDATLGRFWVPDPQLRGELHEFLSEAPGGQLVSEEERTEYAITSRAFGDLIWVVDEGLGISPSFLGRGLSRALHGYHPDVPSQQAVFLSWDPLDRDSYRPKEAYSRMRAGMQSEAPDV